MGRDLCLEALVGGREVFLSPQVAHDLRTPDAELFERETDLRGFEGFVEQPYGHRTVFEVLDVNHPSLLFPDRRGVHAQRILVDGDHLVVGKQRFRERIEPCQIAADEQRRSEHGPERHVRILFVGRELRIVELGAPSDESHDEHVGVGPVSGAAEGRPALLFEADG